LLLSQVITFSPVITSMRPNWFDQDALQRRVPPIHLKSRQLMADICEAS
jgi:hypothetical protein